MFSGFGTCAPYTASSSLCDGILSSSNYVYTLAESDQSAVTATLEPIANIVARSNDSMCQELVSMILCNYYFAPCGSVNGVHLPLSLCEEECVLVRDNCSELWTQVMDQQGIEVIACNETTSRFEGLSACCDGYGIDTGSYVIRYYYAMCTTLISPPPSTSEIVDRVESY